MIQFNQIVIYKGMDKNSLWSAMVDMNIADDITLGGCYMQYFSESQYEILSSSSQSTWYVFKEVSVPAAISNCSYRGNGKLEEVYSSYNGALSFIQNELKQSNDIKKEYVKNFKRHLALNIASMMQGYSDQKYELSQSSLDTKSNIILIDMEIFSNTGSVVVTWRVKESKGRYFVIDLIVADISLVVTKRSEFNSMLKSVNYNLSEFNKILSNQNNESYQKIIN